MAEPKTGAEGANTDDKQPKKVKVLRIVAKREGFRRAGFAFGAEPRDIPLDSLKKEQIEALKSEPMLVVTEADGK